MVLNWSRSECHSEVTAHSNATELVLILEELETTNNASWVFHLQLFSYLSTSCLVCATVARITLWSWNQFVDKVGSTVFHLDLCWMRASGRTFGEADLPIYCTISNGRFITTQPAWVDCVTVKTMHFRYWHFCPCSSLKTIPSQR